MNCNANANFSVPNKLSYDCITCIVKDTVKNSPKINMRPTINTNLIVNGVRQEASPNKEWADKIKLASKSFL